MLEKSNWILVTGGAGFIGGHIAERLIDEGHKVRVLDNLSTGLPSTVEHLQSKAKPGQFEMVEVDLRNAEAVAQAMESVTHVVHEAALPSVQRSVEDPVSTTHVNVDGTLNLLECARRGSVRRFVFAGSSSIYGDQGELPKRESMLPNPLSPYALTKLVGESFLRMYTDLYGLPTVTLRYFNVFGPRQNPASDYAAVIPLFIQALASGKRPSIYGDGRQTRDFTFIDNIVDANLLALDGRGPDGSVYNIACGDRISLLELLDELQELLGTEIEPVFEAARQGDVRDSQAAIDEAVRQMGFRPRTGFREGLERTVEWFRAE
jgi:UDP-glucose 4-epimerase